MIKILSKYMSPSKHYNRFNTLVSFYCFNVIWINTFTLVDDILELLKEILILNISNILQILLTFLINNCYVSYHPFSINFYTRNDIFRCLIVKLSINCSPETVISKTFIKFVREHNMGPLKICIKLFLQSCVL